MNALRPGDTVTVAHVLHGVPLPPYEGELVAPAGADAWCVFDPKWDTLCTYPTWELRPVGFTCPECNMTSYDPCDAHYSYCGNCHKFTDVTETPEAGGDE